MSDVSAAAPAAEDEADILRSRQAGGRFLRGSSLRLLAFGGGLLGGLVATPFAVRHLGRINWGEFVTVTSLIFIVAAITEGGLGQMGIRELSVGSPDQRREFMRDLLGMRLLLTTAGALLAVAFTLIADYDRVMVEGTALAGIGMLVMNVAWTFALPLMTTLRLGWIAVIDFVPQFVTAALMLVLVGIGARLLPFFLVSFVAYAATLVLAAWLIRNQFSLRPAFRPRRWRRLLASTIVYAATTAMGAVYFRIVLIAVSLIATKVATGYFSLAFRILDLTAAVPWLIISSAFPILVHSAHDDEARLRYALQRLLEGSLIFGLWLALCLVIGAPFAVHVIGGHGFQASVPVLRILGAAIPATFMIATWSYALLSMKRFRELLIINGAIIVLAIVLCVLLIPPAGARGAAVVSVVLEYVLAASYLVALIRVSPVLRPALGQIARVVVAAAAAFAAGVLLIHHPVIGVLSGSVVLGAALVVLRAIPRELIEAARR